MTSSVRGLLVLGAAVAGLAGCAAGAPVAAPSTPSPTATAVAPSPEPDASATSFALCAEFPVAYGPQDPHVGLEGWWNGSPADQSGEILRDPADWPAEPRTHPRVAVVDTDDGAVLETWDRVACGEDPSYAYVPGAELPADSVAVVDMDTGEVLRVVARPDVSVEG